MTPEREAQMREMFEREFAHMPLRRGELKPDSYWCPTTACAWEAWLACARAQADARPVAWMYDHPGSGANLSFSPPSSFGKDELSEMEVTVHALYTHPEASAPGLSREDSDLLRELLYRVEYDPGSPTEEKLHQAYEIITRGRAATLPLPPTTGLPQTAYCASAATVAEPKCAHRIVDARNPIVKSGYLCIDCGAVFGAADHDGAKQQVEPSDEAASYKRMFEDAVRSLAAIDEALGIDPDESGGAAPILEAIAALKKQAAQQQAEPILGGLVALPEKMPASIYRHETLGELYDRLAVHKYAISYANKCLLAQKPTDQQAEPGADERAAVDPLTQALPFAILADEMKALRRFHECATDDEGYDVSKGMMKRLSEIGLVRRVTSNIYEHTDFGLAVLNGDFAAQSGQQSVPGADERAAFDQEAAIRAEFERLGDREGQGLDQYWKDAFRDGFNAAVKRLAAQSGQRAGVAEDGKA